MIKVSGVSYVMTVTRARTIQQVSIIGTVVMQIIFSAHEMCLYLIRKT